MILGISGKIGSGKDTVGKIVQYISSNEYLNMSYSSFCLLEQRWYNYDDFTIQKFASKLKQIVSILTGIPLEDLEKQEVKDRVLREEWGRLYCGRDNERMKYVQPKGINTIGYYECPACKTSGTANLYAWKNMTVRQLLQEVGTEAMRDVIHPNIWVNALFADYKFIGGTMDVRRSKVEYPNWIITDMRFPNELQAVKDRGGITIRVNRDFDIKVQHSGKVNDFTIEKFDKNNPKHSALKQGDLVNQHPSETALDNAKFDYVIKNNGTIEELIEKVKEILINEK